VMRIFSDPMEMVREVERDLYEMGHRYQTATVQDQNVADDPRYETLELFGYSYTLNQVVGDKMMEMVKYTTPHLENWVQAELRERTDLGAVNKNPGHAWVENQDFWKQFIRNGTFSYTYAERWHWQIPYVIRELQEHPNTRQAIISMYMADRDLMNWGGHDRVPCSLTYQFGLRNGYLHCIYSQRSCDFLKFFTADVYFACGLLAYMAKEIGADVGSMIHFLGSLHAFQGDMDKRGIF